MVTGLPKTIVVTAAEIRRALDEPITAIIDAVTATLDSCPPELAGDVMERGITITGGGALLRGLDERLAHETGTPVHVADHPLESVAVGAGRCVEEFEVLRVLLAPKPGPLGRPAGRAPVPPALVRRAAVSLRRHELDSARTRRAEGSAVSVPIVRRAGRGRGNRLCSCCSS